MSRASTSSAAPRAVYSKEELADIYALAKMSLETGQLKRAETILRGLTTVAPEFVPGWLAMAVCHSTLGNPELAQDAARRALKMQPDSAAAMMLLVTAALTLGDVGTAGTYLGEIGELVDQGRIADPNLLRLFKMQMARFSQGK
jgi:predicted Zn-dependent protease